METHSSILAWRIPMDRGAWRVAVHGGRKESDTTERLSTQRLVLDFLPLLLVLSIDSLIQFSF